MLRMILGQLAAGRDLSQAEMQAALDAILRGQASDPEIGLFLTGLHLKGETVDEVAGAAAALRAHMTPIESTRQRIVDTCGTGGDGTGTFNISTAAALVVAAAGVPVAKHGNRRASSRTGSADVLTELGVNVEADLDCVRRCLETLGICFCFAPLWHGAMKQVASVRRQLETPTIFNLLGPLANPAGAPYQLIGVGRAEQRPLVAAALARLGTRRSVVVHGRDGLDEVTLDDVTDVSLVCGTEVTEIMWSPDDFGLVKSSIDQLQAVDPAESAAIIRRVLAGEPGPARDVVLANAAAALWVAEAASDMRAGVTRAAEAVDSGAASQLLARLVRVARSGSVES